MSSGRQAAETTNGAQASLAPPRVKGEGFYSPQLDGLRFIAAVLVFFNHGPRIQHLGLLTAWSCIDWMSC
jgi:hypothetical protein